MTDRLYYNDSFLNEFEARVLAVAGASGGISVVLDRSAFYPTSGGQVFDTGWLEVAGDTNDAVRLRVREVAEDERTGDVLHMVECESSSLQAGAVVRGVIDAERRRDHMQQHSGQHVLSAIVQYAPYALKQGWQAQRQRFTDVCIDTLESVAPGLRSSIAGAELLTPVDMEREFRISGGHWHHGDLAFDQFLMVRPVPGAAQHRTPLEGLFLCGAGCHPGGGVMGIAGRNAAQQVLQQASAR